MDDQSASDSLCLPIEQTIPTDQIQLATVQAAENSASVDLSIKYDALSVSVRSQTNLAPELIELAAQVRILKEQLCESVAKVEDANYKIGFLQAQVLVQQEQIKELREKGGMRLPAKTGIWEWFRKRFSGTTSRTGS
jgi:hypothetical protein